MNERDILGKHFEFVKNFFVEPVPCGIVDLYQLGDICLEGGYEIEQHPQFCHEISYIISGRGKFFLNGRWIPVKQGDVFACSKGQQHAITVDNDSTLRYVYVGFVFNDKAAAPDFEKVRRFFEHIEAPLSPDRVDLMIPFLRAVDEFYGKPDFYFEMIEAYLRQILILTFRCYQNANVPLYIPQKSINAVGFTVYSVIRYIDKNIFEIKDIRSISENLGYSYSYLSHLFKDKTGMTLQQYINYKKIEKALELLKYGNLSVTQVAMRLNYETVQSFSKAFKRTMSFSPNEYVKKQLHRDENSVK